MKEFKERMAAIRNEGKQKYKIVVDSCCELPDKLRNDKRFQRIPLLLRVGKNELHDDDQFNQAEFLKQVAECPECPKSSCPAPGMFSEAYDTDAENVYVVTLSASLSGSYNSAKTAEMMYEEEKEAKKNICVIDSKSASCGETQIALKIMELENEGLSFDEIVSKVKEFVDGMKTYFVLDNIETLRKNGRLSQMKALIASTLNIKPILSGTQDGTIEQKAQVVGIKKALRRMADIIAEEVRNTEQKRLVISHCNCLERAEAFKNMLLQRIKVKDIIILDTAGISSMYANDGGIIVSI